MALVRILVDGYSLLHNWPRLAPGRPRHSAAARDELVRRLTHYNDVTGTPITIVFDGASADRRSSETHSTPQVEIIYSRASETADQIIERAAHLFSSYGEVMAVSDDNAERETVRGVGGITSTCWNFIQTVESTLSELKDDVKHHNRKERNSFNRPK